MVRIAVLISGSGTNLQALIDATKRKYIDGEIVLVVSNRIKAYGLERAKNANIKAECIKDEKLLIERLQDEKVDLIVLAGYLAIISEELINLYENKIINIHPSLIPAFCGTGFYGLKVHEEALKRGVKVVGATVHFVDKGTDTGPILLQKAVAVQDGDTPKELQQRVMEQAEWILLPKAIDMIANGKVTVVDGKTVVRK